MDIPTTNDTSKVNSSTQPLHFDYIQQVNVSNVCGFGNHPACEMVDNGCNDFCHGSSGGNGEDTSATKHRGHKQHYETTVNTDSLEQPQSFV